MDVTTEQIEAVKAQALECAEPHDLGQYREHHFIQAIPKTAQWLLMSGRNYADLRKRGRNRMDPETTVVQLRLGNMGEWDGITVLVSRAIPHEAVYVINENIVMRIRVIR